MKQNKTLKPSELGLVPLRNFGIIFSNMNIFRSAQPIYEFEYEWIGKVLGVKTIINLRKEADIDAKLAHKHGIPFHFTIQVKDHEPPTIQQALTFYGLIKDCLKPVLFHCEHGRGRTSTFSVICKMAHGMTFEQAMQDEQQRFHYQFQHEKQEEFLKEFNDYLKSNDGKQSTTERGSDS